MGAGVRRPIRKPGAVFDLRSSNPSQKSLKLYEKLSVGMGAGGGLGSRAPHKFRVLGRGAGGGSGSKIAQRTPVQSSIFDLRTQARKL